jgi:hypothetical protein
MREPASTGEGVPDVLPTDTALALEAQRRSTTANGHLQKEVAMVG